jgi:hypothetical protein
MSLCFRKLSGDLRRLHYGAKYIIEPRNDKTNIVRLRPAWIQTSLRIRAVWLGSMLFAFSFSTCNRVGKRTVWILIRLRGCAGWSGSMLVASALRWYCRDAAHILFYFVIYILLNITIIKSSALYKSVLWCVTH